MSVTKSTQPGRRPARLPAAERREQILDVTKRIVGEDGLHAVSIDRVAREAGISRPIVYEHFSNLGGLLNALLEREAEGARKQLVGVMAQLAPAAPDPREVLLAALSGYLEAVRSEPVRWRLVLTPPDTAPELMRERIEEERAAIIAQLALLTETTFAPTGGPTTPDPELTANSMSALSDAWSRLMLEDPERFTIDRILVHARWMLARLAGEAAAPG